MSRFISKQNASSFHPRCVSHSKIYPSLGISASLCAADEIFYIIYFYFITSLLNGETTRIESRYTSET